METTENNQQKSVVLLELHADWMSEEVNSTNINTNNLVRLNVSDDEFGYFLATLQLLCNSGEKEILRQK